ncbi:hypothetical protein OGATHE_003339 [Ogataea polymorpha]|uniref:Uncharacterized protein n=1 Tax=Ogataea polymorpha TaxID=460523 RepID=A0A9P8P3U2_9ASCO|nr:hypothetical protein OGATHE_003339 [Ogataea polymorpha]
MSFPLKFSSHAIWSSADRIKVEEPYLLKYNCNLSILDWVLSPVYSSPNGTISLNCLSGISSNSDQILSIKFSRTETILTLSVFFCDTNDSRVLISE